MQALDHGTGHLLAAAAVRGLSLLGLIDVRHGSGTYVTADSTELVALSLGTVIQMGRPENQHVLGILGVLNQYAARQAAENALEDELQAIDTSLAAMDAASTIEDAAAGVREFHQSIAIASHNPLLSALCKFLVEIQIEFARELAGGSMDVWRHILQTLHPSRIALVKAIRSGSGDKAAKSAQKFHGEAIDIILSLPRTRELQNTDPRFDGVLSAMMSRI